VSGTVLPVDGITYHGRLAGGWEQRYRKPSFKARERVLLKCLEARNIVGTLWLDAGCGTGTLSRWLAERGCCVMGFDGAPEMVRAAVQHSIAHSRHGQLAFARVDSLACLPVPDVSVDGLLCSSVLEYVSSPAACLAEFARVLKPGGQLLVSVPNRNSMVRHMQLASHRLSKMIGGRCFDFLEYSTHQYSPREFRSLLTQSGFTTSNILSFGSPLPRLAQRSSGWASLLMFAAQKSA